MSRQTLLRTSRVPPLTRRLMPCLNEACYISKKSPSGAPDNRQSCNACMCWPPFRPGTRLSAAQASRDTHLSESRLESVKAALFHASPGLPCKACSSKKPQMVDWCQLHMGHICRSPPSHRTKPVKRSLMGTPGSRFSDSCNKNYII